MKSRSIEVLDAEGGAHRLNIRFWGDAAKPALLCVHGLTRNGQDFNRLATALQNDFYVIAPDMPGRGESPPLANKQHYQYPFYLQDLVQLLAQLNITQCVWVGTSMGGILGMMMAAFYPDKVKALVLNDIGSVVAKKGLERIASYAGIKNNLTTRTEFEAEIRRIAAPFGLQSEGEWQEFIAATLTEENGITRFNYDPDIMLPYREQTKNYTEVTAVDLTPVWEAVTCPTLILRGEYSDILTKETAENMALRENVRVETIPGTGHAPALMTPSQIALITDWLRANALNS